MTYDEFLTTTQASELFEGLQYDEEDQARIEEWFGDRYICNNDRFFRLFRRKLRLVQGNYNNYKRIESIEIDPLVADYMEREHKSQGGSQTQDTRQGTSTSTHSNEGTSQSDLTHGLVTLTTNDLTDTSTGNGTSTRNSTGGNHTVTKNTGEDTTTDKATTGESRLDGVTPQSQTYVQETPGTMPALNWLYTSSQAQSLSNRDGVNTVKHDTTTDADQTTTGEETSSQETSRTDTSTGTIEVANSGTDKTVGSTTDKGSVESTQSDSGRSETSDNRTDRERYSGRHESPQDLLARARDYVINTDSFEWLVAQLEPCFYQILT